MKGVTFLGDNKLVIKDLIDPKPGFGQVLVRMKASGLCGSDVHGLFEAHFSSTKPLKVIGGHEPCGIVEETGDGVRWLKKGDRVMIHHNKGCGHCIQCQSGWFNACEGPRKERGVYGWDTDGGFADMMIAEDRNCVPLPEYMSYEEGAMCTCGVGTAYFATKRLEINSDDTVAIVGCGPVGLGGILIAKAYGARVIAADVVDYRIRLAKAVGADEVIDSKKENSVDRIKELTDGKGASVTIDYSGSAVGRNNVIDAAAVWGRASWIGENNDLPEMTLSPTHQMLGKQLKLYTSRTFGKEQLIELPEFLRRHNIKLGKIITHRYPLERISEAIEVFRTGETGKVIFIWQ